MAGHQPVLLAETLALLAVRPGDGIVDGTLGGGGHAFALAEATGSEGWLLGVDWDPVALEVAEQRLAALPARRILRSDTFERIPEILQEAQLPPPQAVLLDLGLSSMQIDAADRGFSFRHDGPLDMRMDPTRGESAGELLDRLSVRELADILFELGEERRSRILAPMLLHARRSGRLRGTMDLARIIARGRSRERIHPATRTFQALRIAVNRELDRLDRFLSGPWGWLAPGARLAILSYHSLEDRRVKQVFREGSRKGRWRLLTPKVIRPSRLEVRENRRARSARLRVVRLVGESPSAMARERR